MVDFSFVNRLHVQFSCVGRSEIWTGKGELDSVNNFIHPFLHSSVIHIRPSIHSFNQHQIKTDLHLTNEIPYSRTSVLLSSKLLTLAALLTGIHFVFVGPLDVPFHGSFGVQFSAKFARELLFLFGWIRRMNSITPTRHYIHRHNY